MDVRKNRRRKNRWYAGFKAVFVAVLITAGGTIITSINNYYVNSLTEKRQAYTDSKAEALKIQKKMTNKMNDRYVYALRVVSAYNWKTDQQDKRYTEYDDSVKRWNDELIINLSDIKRYFGEDARKDVYNIISRFNKIHVQIMKIRNLSYTCQPLPKIKPLLNEVYEMDDVISSFADRLQEQLREGKVDIYHPVPPTKDPNKGLEP